MNKRNIMIITTVSMLILIIMVSAASARTVHLKSFVGEQGRTVKFPVTEERGDLPVINISYELPDPETVKIGDVFKSDNGYERVIAISEKDGYISEVISDE